MTDDDHKGDQGDAGEDETELRGTSAGAESEDEGDVTRIRRKPAAEETQILPAQDAQETSDSGEVDIFIDRSASADADDDEEDATELRARPRPPQDVDDDDATEIGGRAAEDFTSTTVRPGSPVEEEDATELRGVPLAEGGADGKDELTSTTIRPGSPIEDEDATELRGRADDSSEDLGSTTVRPGSPLEGEDATELRGAPSDEDATEINSKTQSMPQVTRASLGPAKDAPRLQGRDQTPEDDEADATFLRGSPGATESDATRLRPESLPSDDDETVAGAAFGDDDATVQGMHVRLSDDDATVQASGRALGDEDATVQAGAGDDDPTVQGGATSQAPPPPMPRATRTVGPGAVLKGRFTLEDKLGAGGMGGVFKAVDLVKQEARDRNPYVAVKVLNEAFAEHEDSFLALQRESSRSQRLTHPNIAAVYDFDRDGDTAYMVMELLKGSPLDSYLKKNKQGLDPEEARNIIRDIAAALAYAHTQSPALVHSDFKPGNIFFTDEGVAKVFDFGIARAATESSDDVIKNEGPIDVDAMTDDGGEDGTLFDAGKLGALTPAYAAVEMFEGRDPAPQDDVYALGIVAYQCLTGKHPFNRQKAPVAAAQGMTPERPDGVTNREWRAIRRALEFKREDRTPDAQAFLDEFFYTGTKTLLAVAATAATMAIGVAALYYTGVIGPGEPTADPNPDWVALESEISVPRTAVGNLLADARFTTNDEFVAWEGQIRQNLTSWDGSDAPKIVLTQTLPDEQAAIDEQKRIFLETELSVAIAPPTAAGGEYRLTAGPFRELEATDADGKRLSFDEFRAALDAVGLDYVVERDDAAIAAARDDALDVYLAEFERRLPQDAPPRVDAVVRQNDQILRGLSPDPANEQTREVLDAGGFWIVDPERQTELASVQARIRAAGLDSDEQDRLRGPSVLARAEQYFPTRPADIAEARERAVAEFQRWGSPIADAQARASRYQSNYVGSLATFAALQAAENERGEVADARREGGVVTLSQTIGEFEPQLDAARILERTTDADGNPALVVEFPGVFEVFSRQCNRPQRVEAALVDYPYLPEGEQTQSLRYLADCMTAKLEKDTDEILETRGILLASVDYEPIALIERPDPCGALGYVGAGRNAFCRDTWTGGSAPPVVIIDAPGSAPNYGIGKYEVSVAEYNAFAAATGRDTLAAPSGRLPATGVELSDARAYAAWLSRRTDRTYRLPTVSEWRHAASAGGDTPDPNRNCYSNIRGVIRGDTLVNVGQGAPNAWGLVNHVGNVEEWAVADDGVIALGGRHTDPISECTVDSTREDASAPDVARGFRILREIDGIVRSGAALASAGGN